MASPPSGNGADEDDARHALSRAETLHAQGTDRSGAVVETAVGLESIGGAVVPPTLPPRQQRSPDLEAGTMVGEYRIEDKLGEGGMGRVFAAIHPVIGKRAAIKVLRRELCASTDVIERFVQEARAVNQIRHPNIVDIFGFGELPDGRSYFAMERLDGESLWTRLRRGLPPLAETCLILDEVATALAAAHTERIVHRDLKPDNVYLCAVRGAGFRVKLLDFGIAKLLDDDAHRLERTRTGNMMGTPMYIAPEQARGYDVGTPADVYSLGVMAFEMVTGRPPFVADNAMDLIAKHLHEAPPSPSELAPGLPPALSALILGMLDKEPSRRPELDHVRAVLADVAAIARDMLPLSAQVASTVPEVRVPRQVLTRRRRGRGLLIAVVALGGAGAAAIAGLYGRQAPPTVAPGVTAPAAAPAVTPAAPEAAVVAPDAAVPSTPAAVPAPAATKKPVARARGKHGHRSGVPAAADGAKVIAPGPRPADDDEGTIDPFRRQP